jgi:hypothetical protein
VLFCTYTQQQRVLIEQTKMRVLGNSLSQNPTKAKNHFFRDTRTKRLTRNKWLHFSKMFAHSTNKNECFGSVFWARNQQKHKVYFSG